MDGFHEEQHIEHVEHVHKMRWVQSQVALERTCNICVNNNVIYIIKAPDQNPRIATNI